MQKLRPLSPFLAWPSFVAKQPASFSHVVTNLYESQWWSLPELEAGWQVQLKLLLEWATNNVPYYQRSDWAQHRMKMIRRHPDNFWEEWRKIPLLTKAGLRAHSPDILMENLPRQHRLLGMQFTSGSTGIPVKILRTSISHLNWYALTVREHLMHRRDFHKRLGMMRYLPLENRDSNGVDHPNWGKPVTMLYSTGPSSSIHVSLPLDAHIEWLHRFNPHYLLTYPSVAASLLNEIGSASDKPPALEELRLISEPLDDELEERLTREWGVRCTDIYSANEVGYIAVRCPEQGNLHVQGESIFTEILNDEGEICKPGETGRVVVTTLHNLATPLVRYEIGDYAIAGDPCPCGRGSPVISKVLGRVRNYVRTPDGGRIWPSVNWFGTIDPILQAQHVQTSPDTIELRMMLKQPLSDDQEAQAIELVKEMLDYPFQIKLVAVDEIKRGPTGKYEEFISLVE